MPDVNDMDLLREFVRENSEAAFAEIVRRHIDLVYSVAFRYTGNSEDARDVAQATFLILTRKAVHLREHTALTGWLYETTRFAALGFLRTQNRRQIHEQEAYMESTLNETSPADLWEQLAPHLEAGMSRLGKTDRALLALRYYENKSGAETAAALGIGEAAVYKRTARALEKLRQFFHRRGVVSTTAMIAGAMTANSLQAAPAGLAHTISAIAITKGAVAGGSTLTLVHKALKLMAWSTTKTAIVASVTILLATGAATVAVKSMMTPSVPFIRIEGKCQIELYSGILGDPVNVMPPKDQKQIDDYNQKLKTVSRVVETGHLVILTDGKSYRISLVSKGGGTLSNDVYDTTAEYGSDGVDNFVISDRNSPLNRTPGGRSGFANSGRVPVDQISTFSTVYAVWLAYCSKDFFNNPVHLTGLGIGQGFGSMIWPDYVTNLVTYWPDSPLPQSITGWSRNWIIAPRTNSLQPIQALELKQYPHGFKTWKFTASDPVTVGDMRVPRQLTLEMFFPKSPNTATTGDDTAPLKKATFTVDSVEMGHGQFEPLPPVTVPDLQVYDHRFEEISGNFVIASHATPKGWPIRGSKAFEQAAADARRLGVANHAMIQAELKNDHTVNPP
jgi:RNA polymerase sigma factor (sigma-70 family)